MIIVYLLSAAILLLAFSAFGQAASKSAITVNSVADYFRTALISVDGVPMKIPFKVEIENSLPGRLESAIVSSN